MKLRGLLTASALLAVLTGLLWWSNRKEARATKEPVDSKSAKLFTAREDQIQEIEIQKQNGEIIQLKRNAGKWQITEPKQLAADPEAVSSLLSTLSSVNADHVIEDKATNVEPYGLAQPSVKIGIVESNNKHANCSSAIRHRLAPRTTRNWQEISACSPLPVTRRQASINRQTTCVTSASSH